MLIAASTFCTPWVWCSMPRACIRKLVFAVPHHSAAWRIGPLGDAGHLGRLRAASTRVHVLGHRSKPTVWSSMKSWSSQSFSIIRCRTPLNRAASRPGLTGRNRSQVRASGVIRGSTTMTLAPVLAGLPDVVGRDRGALGDVRPADPDHLGPEDVGHGLAARSMPNAFLFAGRGADHAQPAVVVDVRRLQADAGELAHQVGLLGRQARPAEHGEGVVAVGRLDAVDLGGDAADRLVVGHRAEARRGARVAA